MNYYDYLKSEKWKKISLEVKRRAGNRCQVCNSGIDLQAHHRTYEVLGKEEENMGDLICLCRRCHALFHGKEVKPAQKQNENVFFKRKEQQVDSRPLVALEGRDDKEEVELTNELIDDLMTIRGGMTGATIRALNVPQPLVGGWIKRLVGTKITVANYRKAYAARLIYHKRVPPVIHASQVFDAP